MLTFNNKFHLLQITTHLISIYVLIMFFDPIWLLGTYISWFLVKLIGGEIGAHRYFVHRSFKTTRPKEILLMILQWFNGEGSLLAWCGVHSQHHKYSDQELDPHSPQTKSIWKVVYWVDPININPKYVVRLAKDKMIMFQHNNYFLFHFLLLFVAVVTNNIKLYGYIVALPIVLTLYTNAVVDVLTHLYPKFGYRNFDLTDCSANLGGAWKYILLGGELHHNHHANQTSYTNKVTEQEVDILGAIIDTVFAVKQN